MEIGRGSRTASDLRRRPAGAHLAIGGACIGLTVFAALRCRTIRLLYVPIKLADEALKAAGFLLAGGPRSLPHLLLFSYKALLKSYKAAARLDLIKAGEKGSSFGAGRIKAAWGAMNLARYAVAASVGGMLGFDLLKAGYKASKSLGKVVEGLVGVRIDSSFRGVIEALGMYVSAVSLCREYAKIAALGSKSSTCRFAGKAASCRSYVCVVGQRVRFGGEVYKIEAFDDSRGYLPLHVRERLAKEARMDCGVSELLSLSIPIPPHCSDCQLQLGNFRNHNCEDSELPSFHHLHVMTNLKFVDGVTG